MNTILGSFDPNGPVIGFEPEDGGSESHLCFKFLDDHRTLVEPACGATLATLYNKKMDFSPSDNILVIVCGGASISLEQLLKYSSQ